MVSSNVSDMEIVLNTSIRK